MLPIASRVQPQDLPCRTGRRQRVQHRQNRRRSDSRAEQHHRPLSGLQDEASARRADVESIAHPDMLAQVGSSGPIRLDLYADSIALRREGTRERVAAKKWRAAGGRVEDARPRTGPAEPLAAADRPGSASSARGRPRTPDRSPSPRAAEIPVQPDARLLPARAPRCHSPRQSFGSAVTPQTTSAIRAKAPRSAKRAPVDRVDDWANREAR